MPKHSEGITNDQRAKVAYSALRAYEKAADYQQFYPAEILGDLLGDLRHWADRHNVDFDQCAKNAKACYLEEKGEDNDAAN